MSSSLVFDSAINRYYFPQLNDSTSSGSVDYDGDINANVEYFTNLVLKFLTVQELNPLYHSSELKKTRLFKFLVKSVQNPPLAGYLSTGNRSSFLYVEGSTAWFYDCPPSRPLFLKLQLIKIFSIPIYYQGPVMHIDPITRQIVGNSTPKSCNILPQNLLAIDPENDEHYVLTPKPVLWATPALHEPN